jgi:hypothetical protein
LGDFRVLFAILGLKRGEYVASSLAQCKGILEPRVLSSFAGARFRGISARLHTPLVALIVELLLAHEDRGRAIGHRNWLLANDRKFLAGLDDVGRGRKRGIGEPMPGQSLGQHR